MNFMVLLLLIALSSHRGYYDSDALDVPNRFRVITKAPITYNMDGSESPFREVISAAFMMIWLRKPSEPRNTLEERCRAKFLDGDVNLFLQMPQNYSCWIGS